MENNNIEIDLDNEVSPNRSLRSPLSLKNTNLETTVHEIRRKEKRNYTSITYSYFTKCSDINGELCICTFLDEKGNRCGKTYRNMGSSTGNLLRHLDEAYQICSNSHNNKKVRTQNSQPHPPDVQRQREELILNICYTRGEKIRTMIGRSFNHSQQILQNLINETSQNIKDVMLEIEYIPAPHISEMIANSFYKFISSWNLRNRITSITIDNGANMVAAVRSLKEKPGYVIVQLQTDLCISTNNEDKRDGKKLKNIMLSDEEWELIDQLVNLLMPFENATCEFSALSPINPSEDNTAFGLEEIIEPIEVVEVDDNEPNIYIYIYIIYYSLIYYWNIPIDSRFLATLLDPHYKNLDCVEVENKKTCIMQKLYYEYESMKGTPIPVKSPEYLSTDANKNTHSYKQYHQNRLDKKKKKALNELSEEDEITRFLEMQVALEVENPLEYERLFLNARSLISPLRNRLNPTLVTKMLFLKRNIKVKKVFTPDWNNLEDEALLEIEV
ncbi:hypothetical protein RhiirA5_436211 [Rhizophagus irregularis]|uniref:BED-type domain-containing protein n=1 Tax=Rhizophagus irregularis TaxID=588596 RepID=A0A2N0NM89_9GLOM|nr:hypothetical protein RhiirA5_436211 [Rhizophagus irregularis]